MAGLAAVASPWAASAQAPAAAAARMDLASAVERVGRQRMLSQRMVKAYLMLGQDIAADDARAILNGSIRQFESQLAELKTFQPTPDVRRAVATLDAAWTACRARLTEAPTKAGAVALYDANEALQAATHGAILAYEAAHGAPLDPLLNLGGRQQMLSQRMAKFYFYRTWGLYDAAADMELHLSRAHFNAVLDQIERSPVASARAKAGVTRIRREWEPYQQALFASREPAAMRRDGPRVAELSERVSAVALAVQPSLHRPNP